MKQISVFFGSIFFFLIIFASSAYAQSVKDTLEDYCRPSEGAYFIPDPDGSGELACGTAPNICGIEYDRDGDGKVRDSDGDPVNYTSVDDCWNPVESSKRCDGWGMCYGEVPLCCYYLEATGDPKKCAWPERGYCLEQQCDQISGEKMNCGGPIGTWCNNDCDINKDDIPYIPLSVRVGGVAATPTNIPVPTTSPVATNTPTPNVTPPPNTTNTPTPSPTPTETTCSGKQLAGDYNCDDTVDDSDFTDWKTDFELGSTPLNFFEYWRSARY